MLSLETVLEISRLLAEGALSQRAIARRLQVSRGSVQGVATGRRGIYGREPQRRDDFIERVTGPAERCPQCGGMVFAPCLLCAARAYRHRQEAARLVGGFAPGRRVA